MISASHTLTNTPQQNPGDRQAKSGLARERVVRRAVRFGLEMPNAHKVSVVGTFNNWDPEATPLRSVGSRKWYVYAPVEVGRHEYRFVVDGKPVDEPKAELYVPNAQGGRNAVLEVSGSRRKG